MRKSSVLLGIISVTFAVSAGYFWWQLRAERDHVAMLEQRLAAQTAAPAPSPVTSALVPESTAPSSTVPASAVAAADPAATRQQEVNKQIRVAQAREREMMKDPAYRKSRVDDFRRRSSQTRADYIRVVGMTPEQADHVIGLSIERNFRASDLFETGREPMSEEDQAELRRLNDEHHAELREFLGGEKFEQLNQYQASIQERYDANQFRAQLSTTADPLGERQVDALVVALHASREFRSRDYEEYAKATGIVDRNVVSPEDRQRWLDLEKEANQRVHDSMSGTLSRAQLQSLDEMLTGNLAPIEAALRLQLEGRVAKTP